MTSERKQNTGKKPGNGSADKQHPPEWAGGLRQLYDSVVEEPLPDSFMDLLSKLDDEE